LKALVASGGALAAAAFLPSHWTSPVLHAGVLPALAQGSVCAELVAININLCGLNDDCHGFSYQMRIEFTPKILVPSQAQLSCFTKVDSSYSYKGDGVLYVYSDLPPGCLDWQLIVTFRDGCVAIWDFSGQ